MGRGDDVEMGRLIPLWRLCAIEVAAMGIQLAHLCLPRLGFTQRSVRVMIKKASEIALKCSFWIWLKRMDQDWNHTE